MNIIGSTEIGSGVETAGSHRQVMQRSQNHLRLCKNLFLNHGVQVCVITQYTRWM